MHRYHNLFTHTTVLLHPSLSLFSNRFPTQFAKRGRGEGEGGKDPTRPPHPTPPPNPPPACTDGADTFLFGRLGGSHLLASHRRRLLGGEPVVALLLVASPLSPLANATGRSASSVSRHFETTSRKLAAVLDFHVPPPFPLSVSPFPPPLLPLLLPPLFLPSVASVASVPRVQFSGREEEEGCQRVLLKLR